MHADGKLTAQRGGSRPQVLTPISVDDFLYEDGFGRLKLERDRSGKISGIRFFANWDGNGELGVRTNEPLPAAPVGVQVPRAALERLVGTYANGDLTMKVFLDGEALKSQLPGQPPVTLRATSATKFDVVEADASLEPDLQRATLNELLRRGAEAGVAVATRPAGAADR